SRVAAVSARPRAAVAVGSVPWRRRASSTTPVVTAARPRTVPSTESVRATRSATAGLRGGYELPHGPEQVLRRDRADEPPPLAPATTGRPAGPRAAGSRARCPPRPRGRRTPHARSRHGAAARGSKRRGPGGGRRTRARPIRATGRSAAGGGAGLPPRRVRRR